MSKDDFVRGLGPALIATLALLSLGCRDVTIEQDIELEPGIDLPDTTGDTDDDPGRDTEPGRDPTSGGVDESSDGEPPPEPTGTTTGEPSNDEGGPPTCDEETLQLAVDPPQIVLLLDKSYSMIESSWDHDGDPMTPTVTRWHSLHGVVDALTHDVEDGVELGMVLFPSPSVPDNGTGTACMVDPDPAAAIALHNADAIVDALPAADALDLYGGTPVGAGMTVALDHLADVYDGRPQAVILVTDGAANCMEGTSGMGVFTEYDQGLAPLVAGAFAAGIPTYVVGVDIVDAVGVYPQDNPYLRLSEIAEAGGVPNEGGSASFYNTTDEAQLLTALDGIAADIGCTFQLDTAAQFVEQVTVRVGGDVVPRVDECPPDGVGWRFLQDAAPYDSIELCAATCDVAQVEASIDLDYACPPQG